MGDSSSSDDGGELDVSSTSTSTGEIPGESSLSSSDGTADLDTSTSTGAEDESTGPALLPEGAPCDDAARCITGACSLLGACALTCPCATAAICVAAACITVGEDEDGADIAFNDSPLGTVESADDVDVFNVNLPNPGSYRVMVNGAGVTAWVVDSAGLTVATPADASELDEDGVMTARDFDIADASAPMSVLIVGPSVDSPTDYYFYTIAL